jgi:S-formylglutathione hydrolase FrmB
VAQALLSNKENLPPIRFDCGTEDPLIEHNRELSRELKKAGIPHTYEEFSGGHSWPYWETHLEDMLHFFGSQLK